MTCNILITGASSGIGAALAVGYAAQGITLYILGRDAARLEAVATLCRQRGANVAIGIIDVTDKHAMADFITRMDDAAPIDLVIANAGISSGSFAGEGSSSTTSRVCHSREGGNLLKNSEGASRLRGNDKNQSLCSETFSAAQAVFDVNLQGVLNTIHPLIERMKMRRQGHIAIMSSLAGICALPSAPAYSASKAAVRVYGDALRGMLKPCNVHVSVICPGWVSTPLTDKNRFPMPFIMPVARAIHIIMRKLEQKKARISFPFLLYAALRMIALLPVCASDFLLQKISSKAGKT